MQTIDPTIWLPQSGNLIQTYCLDVMIAFLQKSINSINSNNNNTKQCNDEMKDNVKTQYHNTLFDSYSLEQLWSLIQDWRKNMGQIVIPDSMINDLNVDSCMLFETLVKDCLQCYYRKINETTTISCNMTSDLSAGELSQTWKRFCPMRIYQMIELWLILWYDPDYGQDYISRTGLFRFIASDPTSHIWYNIFCSSDHIWEHHNFIHSNFTVTKYNAFLMARDSKNTITRPCDFPEEDAHACKLRFFWEMQVLADFWPESSSSSYKDDKNLIVVVPKDKTKVLDHAVNWIFNSPPFDSSIERFCLNLFSTNNKHLQWKNDGEVNNKINIEATFEVWYSWYNSLLDQIFHPSNNYWRKLANGSFVPVESEERIKIARSDDSQTTTTTRLNITLDKQKHTFVIQLTGMLLMLSILLPQHFRFCYTLASYYIDPLPDERIPLHLERMGLGSNPEPFKHDLSIITRMNIRRGMKKLLQSNNDCDYDCDDGININAGKIAMLTLDNIMSAPSLEELDEYLFPRPSHSKK